MAKTRMQLVPGDLLELGLRVVHIVNVHAIQAEVLPAARQLMTQIGRCQAVTPRHEVFGPQDRRADERLVDIGPRIRRILAVEGKESALGGHQDLVPRRTPQPDQGAESGAHGPLAALVAVVDRAVQDVTAQLHGANDGVPVELVGPGILVAQIRSEANRGQPEAMEPPKVALGNLGGEPLPEPKGALGRGMAGESHGGHLSKAFGRSVVQ